ncbi:MAG: type IV pilus assembly protein PilM [Clostridiaceae bacterium]|nr:type IV pilus assembly protein PilM [Clostridiaceae bacterium]
MAVVDIFSNSFITIDIGFRYMKIVQVKKNKHNLLSVTNYGIGDTPKGCIKNGAIKDKDAVIEEINRVIKENNINMKEAKIVMSGTNIISRVIMIDKVPENEVDKKIWEEIRETIPVDMNSNRIDYKILGNTIVDGQEKIKVFVTVVAKKIIDNYIDLLKKLRLKPIAVDIPSNSVSKFFRLDIDTGEDSMARRLKYAKYNNNTCIVFDLGSETTIINILKDKTPEFNRVILKGSSKIDEEIAKELQMQPHELPKAELYKKMYGLSTIMTPCTEYLCSKAAMRVMDSLIKEIRMCIDFYLTRCNGEHPSKIFLIGGGSQMKGIEEYFEEKLGLPAYRINVAKIGGLEFNPNLDKGRLNYLVNALGVAL